MQQRHAGQERVETLPHEGTALAPSPLRRADCLCSLPLGEILKKAPEDASQEVGPFEPREMSNLGKLNIAGRRDDLGEVTGHSGRTRIALTMHDQRGYPQVGKLIGQRTALYKVIGIVAKELVDPEIDVQAADKQLPDQPSRMCVVSDVGGPGQFTVGPFGLIKFGPLRGREAYSQVGELVLFIRTEQRRSIGTVLSVPGSVNARPREVDQRACLGGMCETIGKSQRGSPGMPQHYPL